MPRALYKIVQLRRLSKAVIVNQRGEALALRRSHTAKHRPLGIDFPGGGVEEGEDFYIAALREIEEEVGVTLSREQIEVQFADASYEYDANVVRLLFLVKLNETPDIKLSFEHDKFWWMKPEELLEKFEHRVWAKGLRHMVDHKLF